MGECSQKSQVNGLLKEPSDTPLRHYALFTRSRPLGRWRLLDDHAYWEWRDELLKHPEGRATGGEPCVKCSEPVPPNAHWKHRDRHVCCSRCNRKLSRQFSRQLRRQEIEQPSSEPLINTRSDLESPALFRSLTGDSENTWVYEFAGFGPRHGDIVERHGVYTSYELVEPAHLPPYLAELAPHGALAAVHESGYIHASAATAEGYADRLILGEFSPVGDRFPAGGTLVHDGAIYHFRREIIRDIGPDGRDYTWSADIFLPAGSPHPGTIWTAAYDTRSKARERASASTARHRRRMRIRDSTIETFDPIEVFERDGWACQLCGESVDRDLRWPHPMYPSLDHVIPLAAGGSHSRANTQLAHWLCNVRKGTRMPLSKFTER